jgi:hypothetical protein
MMGDHEHPRPEGVVVSLEPVDTPSYVQPGLSDQIIRINPTLPAYIPAQGAVDVIDQSRPCPLDTTPCCIQHRFEGFTCLHLTPLTLLGSTDEDVSAPGAILLNVALAAGGDRRYPAALHEAAYGHL